MAGRSVTGTLVLLIFLLVRPPLADEVELSAKQGIARYEKLVRNQPRKAPYQNALGYYYLKAGNFQEAETHFLEAIQLDDSYATAHNNLGALYLRQQRPKQAEYQFRQALKLNPHYGKAQYNLAVALFRQKRYGKAAQAYLKARELDSDYVERRDNREKLKQALEQVAQDDTPTQELRRMKQWFAPSY